MSDILGTNVITLKTPDSIVSGQKDNPIDYYQPLTFTQWLVRTNSSETDSKYLLDQYKFYLLDWYKVKGEDRVSQQDFVRSAYIGLLREIVLSYTTLEERRFVSNADLTNDLDLYSVLPFFTRKIKSICNYYSLLRENVKFKKYENSLKGSQFGVEAVILNEILKSLNALDIIKTDSIVFNLSGVKNNISIKINEYYDESQYFDLNPTKPYDTYNQGVSSDLYANNLNDFNSALYTDFEQTIIDAIKSYPFFLNDLTTEFSVNVQVAATDLQYLKDRDFINQINNNNIDNLNLNLEKDLIQKFIGTDYYYLSVGSTKTDYVSGLLFKAEDKTSNYLSKRFPSTGTIPNDENFLRGIREIGGFFLPDKLGVLNFNNTKYTIEVNVDNLTPNKIYVFPDPTRFGNISNLSKTDFDTPFIYEEDVSWMKYDRNTQYIFSNVKSNPLLKTFYAYHSRSETIGYQPFGMSRDIDSTEFFTGTAKNEWTGDDVFPVIENFIPLDKRQENLLVKNKSLVKYKTDVYGNNYGLYKEISPVGVGPNGDAVGDFISQDELDFFNFTGGRGGLYGTGRRGLNYNQFLEEREKKAKPCMILDGHVFYDIDQGFNFDYTIVDPEKNYSGVFTRTITQIPPGSGYYTHGINLTSFAPDPFINYVIPYPYTIPPSFKPLPFPLLLIAYGKGHFIPDEFCDVFNISYCLVLDCFTFVDINGNLLTDYSSDLPTWNPSIPVYYNELLEQSLNTDYAKPDTVARPATFSYFFAASTGKIEDLNAYAFNLRGQTPCDVSYNNQGAPDLTYRYDKVDFKDLSIPIESQTQVQSLSTQLVKKRSIYESRYVDKGEFYVKNANTTRVDLVTDALSSVFGKYKPEVRQDIKNGIYNFELYYNVILIETENYIILDKLSYDYDYNIIKPYDSERNFIPTFYIDKNIEKVSVPYFNEKTNTVLFVKTSLFYYNSCTNEKIIYPEVYTIDLTNPAFYKIYPNFELTFVNLSTYKNPISRFYTSSVDKPVLTFNEDTETYVINYFVKDPSDLFMNVAGEFKIENGKLNFLSNKVFVPDFYFNDYNFCEIDNVPGYITNFDDPNNTYVMDSGFMYFAVSTTPPSPVGAKFERCLYATPTPSPTPPLTPTITPSVTPTPTNTLTPTPTPTLTPFIPAACPALIVTNAGTIGANGTYYLSAVQPILSAAPDYFYYNIDTGYSLRFAQYYNLPGYNFIINGAILSGDPFGVNTIFYGSSATATTTTCAPTGAYDLQGYVDPFYGPISIIGDTPYPMVSLL